jgi:RNA polymerase sigma-70 factor (ECF subfamily)
MTGSTATRMDATVERIVRIVPQKSPARYAEDCANVSHSVRDRLVRLAYRFVWNREDAEDVVQDALVAAHERKADLREGGGWWSWVCRIVIQRCHLHGRERLRRKRHQEPYEAEAARRMSQSTAEEPTELKEMVRSLLEQLPRRQHEVIVLRHLQGMTYDQIAKVLDISSATARVHARAARERLRELVLERHASMLDGTAATGGGRQ